MEFITRKGLVEGRRMVLNLMYVSGLLHVVAVRGSLLIRDDYKCSGVNGIR